MKWEIRTSQQHLPVWVGLAMMLALGFMAGFVIAWHIYRVACHVTT